MQPLCHSMGYLYIRSESTLYATFHAAGGRNVARSDDCNPWDRGQQKQFALCNLANKSCLLKWGFDNCASLLWHRRYNNCQAMALPKYTFRNLHTAVHSLSWSAEKSKQRSTANISNTKNLWSPLRNLASVQDFCSACEASGALEAALGIDKLQHWDTVFPCLTGSLAKPVESGEDKRASPKCPSFNRSRGIATFLNRFSLYRPSRKGKTDRSSSKTK
jgi:hypothetical protein